MPDKSTTEEVSNDDRSIEAREEHPRNMLPISTTEEVSNDDRSIEEIDRQ